MDLQIKIKENLDRYAKNQEDSRDIKLGPNQEFARTIIFGLGLLTIAASTLMSVI